MNVELISITPYAERLIERAGRTAYQSHSSLELGSEEKFIRRLLKLGHESVLEHASATFRITGISRAFTHQLVRHRLCSFTQQSQRYVDESSFRFVEPDAIRKNLKAHDFFVASMRGCKVAYLALQELGIKNEDARFVLPNATQSEIVVTANFREWRHIIQLRGSSHAQWEIRRGAIAILRKLKDLAPTVFGDLEIDEESETIVRDLKW